MKEKWLVIFIVGFLALGLAFTGCGDDDDDDVPVPVTTGTIKGQVTATGGDTLAGAKVELKDSNADTTLTCDDDGMYEFKDIEADTVILAVSLDLYESQTDSNVIVIAEDTVAVDFALELIQPDFVGAWDVTSFCYTPDTVAIELDSAQIAGKAATFGEGGTGSIDLYVEVDTLGAWDWEECTFTWVEAAEAGKITVTTADGDNTVEWAVVDDAMTLKFTSDEVVYEIGYAKHVE